MKLLTSRKTFNKKVLVFAIQKFYPSITEKLLNHWKNLAFAQRYIETKQNEIDLKLRKSLLYRKNTARTKGGGNGTFDVTMGGNDGDETCEIVGLFLSYSIEEKLSKDDVGLYRDEGLACFKNNNGHQNDKIRKELTKIFQTRGLK